MPYFKHFKVIDITTDVCEEFSLSLQGLSADTKNKIIIALQELFKPLVSKRIILSNPAAAVERFCYIPKKRALFTKAELTQLYPTNIQQSLEIWGSPLSLAWGLILRDTGCRPSEAIAWRWEDYFLKWGGFVITKRLREGKFILGTKSGDTHYRAAVLSEMGIQAIELLKEVSGGQPTERVFSFGVPQGLIYFRAALSRAGLPEDGRTQYCLRHTAVTHTIDIDRDFAREAFGHTPKVQEGYDHPDTEELFQRLAGAREILRQRLG
jgi:integrase